MSRRNTYFPTDAQMWSIGLWGLGGVIIVGLLALYWVEEDHLPKFMTGGLISFLVLRTFLLWRESRDAEDGF